MVFCLAAFAPDVPGQLIHGRLARLRSGSTDKVQYGDYSNGHLLPTVDTRNRRRGDGDFGYQVQISVPSNIITELR